MALSLQIVVCMNRLFLSGQMTCAMLLGAGLLLRAQAALQPAPSMAAETRPSELTGERARPAPRIVRNEAPVAPRVVHKISHTRKGLAHRVPRSKVRKCGVALAERGFRCG